MDIIQTIDLGEGWKARIYHDIRIYAASLTDYNAGRLHGAWIECDGKTGDEIRDEITAMLAASPTARATGEIAEEWAIHDFELPDWIPRSLIGESTSPDTFAALADLAALADESPHYRAGLALWLDSGHKGAEICADEAREWIDDAYLGESQYGATGWAEESLENQGAFDGASQMLRQYFNFEAYARDLIISGDVDFVTEGGRLIERRNAGDNRQVFAFACR